MQANITPGPEEGAETTVGEGCRPELLTGSLTCSGMGKVTYVGIPDEVSTSVEWEERQRERASTADF